MKTIGVVPAQAETGTIDAKLEVRELLVLGSVVGEVTAKERVEVGPQGRVDGVVRTPRIRIHEGAQVSARLERLRPHSCINANL